MGVTLIQGSLYGDEGKAKICSWLTYKDNAKIIARNGGSNAGHTTWFNGKKYALRMLPSGILNQNSRLLLGAGCLIDPRVLLDEITRFGIDPKRVGVDHRATIITLEHIESDANSELSKSIGTTKSGCGPAATDRTRRSAKLAKDEESIKHLLTDVAIECNASDNLIIEACQGFMLSNLYGDYPFVTSKDTTASTACADVGIGPKKVTDVVLVIKSFTSKVGNGELSDEMTTEDVQRLGWEEFGTVTGRRRRISATLDFDALRYAAMVNSATYIALTKLDARFPESAGKTSVSDLSPEALAFVARIEYELSLPVLLIGTGQDLFNIIDRRNNEAQGQEKEASY